MLWAFLSMIICAIVCVILFVKGNMKVARIIICFYLVALTTIWALVSGIYLIFLFAVPCLAMGIVFIVKDNETNIWGRKKKQKEDIVLKEQPHSAEVNKTKRQQIIEKNEEPPIEKESETKTVFDERIESYGAKQQICDAEIRALRKRYLEEKKELEREYLELSLNLRGEYDRAEEELMRREKKLEKRIENFNQWYERKRSKLETDIKDFNENNGKIKKEEIKKLKNEAWNKFFRKAEAVLEEKYQLNAFFESVGTNRFEKAMSNEVELVDFKMSAEFLPKTDKNVVGNYTTTLEGCTCQDFKNQHMPCKHMLHLAYTVGALQLKSKRFDVTKKQLIEDIKTLTKEKENLEKSVKKLKEKEKKLNGKSFSQ